MTSLFCDGEVFPLDRDLLMGTSIPIRKQSILIAYIVKSIKIKKANHEKRICPIENCRYAIRAKMSDISKVFEVDDILRVLRDILTDLYIEICLHL
jgi:hypothetical protein